MKAWAVPGTPSFIINGKYRTGKGIKTSDDMVKVILYLVALEKPKS